MPALYLVLTLTYCAALFWQSSLPEPPIDTLVFPQSDKVAHAVAYGVLAALVSLGMRRSGRAVRWRRLFWAPVLFASLYGLSDEIHQYFVPGRTFDPLDWLADTVGAVAVQAFLIRKWRMGRAGRSVERRASTF